MRHHMQPTYFHVYRFHNEIQHKINLYCTFATFISMIWDCVVFIYQFAISVALSHFYCCFVVSISQLLISTFSINSFHVSLTLNHRTVQSLWRIWQCKETDMIFWTCGKEQIDSITFQVCGLPSRPFWFYHSLIWHLWNWYLSEVRLTIIKITLNHKRAHLIRSSSFYSDQIDGFEKININLCLATDAKDISISAVILFFLIRCMKQQQPKIARN